MAPKQNELLLNIVSGQAVLATKIDTLNTRLFGGEGQKGAIPLLFEKHEEMTKTIQAVKEDANAEIVKLKTKTTLGAWKTGTISSVGGSVFGIGLTLLFRKILGFHQ